MSTAHDLNQLLSAIQALNELPVMKLAENQTLKREIQQIISGKNIRSITEGLERNFRLEQDAAMNASQDQRPKLSPESTEFLYKYSRYKSAAHGILSEGATPAFIEPVKMAPAVAFNSLPENPMYAKAIMETPEARAFAQAYKDIIGDAKNSIYSDHALQIRTANDPTAISSFIDYSPYVWNYIYYLSIPTLAQTIDLSIQIATRQPPNLIIEDDELKDLLEKVLKRGRFTEKLQKMLLYSHLSPRGALIVPIQDDDGTIRFNVFNDTQFTYATSYQYSRIDFRDNLTGVSSLYVLGHLLQNEVTAHFLCPGFEPIYAIGKNRLYQLKDAAEAINIYLYTIKVLSIRAQVMIQSWGGEGQTDTLLRRMQQKTADINSNLSLNTAVTLPEGATLDILNNNLSEGFSKVSTVIKEYQGMLSGIMPDYFYGSNTAYAANTFNIHATHQNIRSQVQETQIEPVYRFVINKYLEMDKRFAKWKHFRDEFDIEFESLYEPTEIEKTDIATKKIANIVTMAGYPELADIFKNEGLLDEENDLPEIERPEPPEETQGNPGEEWKESGDGEKETEAQNSALIQTIDPKRIQPLHEVRYEPKLMKLVELMNKNGWRGEPLLVMEMQMGMYRGLTGTHRTQAAEIQGLEVPVVVLPSVPAVKALTTGKDKRRLAIVESKEFEKEIGNLDLVKLAREIMRKEVQHNTEGW